MGLILGVVLVGAVSPAVSALIDEKYPIASKNLTDRTKSTMLVYALARCIKNNGQLSGGIDGNLISEANAKSGKWFSEHLTSDNERTDPSFLVAGDGDGRTGCNEAVKAGVTVWGYADGLELLCSFVDKRGNGSSCQTGDGGFGHSSLLGGADRPFNSGDYTKFEDAIKKKLYTSGNALDFETPLENGAGWYLVYQAALTTGCSVKESANPSDDFKYVVTVIDPQTGTPSTKTYEGKKHDTKRYVYTNKNHSSVNLDCQTIAERMNVYADNYRNYINALIATTGSGDDPVVGSPDGGDAPAKSSCAVIGVGWIICPVVNFLANIADSAFTFLSDNFLKIDTEIVSSTGDAYMVWSQMRTIANIIFVIAFLIIIFSQLTGQGIANYGIKKMLPRLIIAAVLVNLSFFICQIAVDLSNILGVSIKSLFETVGNGLNMYDPTASNSETGGAVWSNIAAGVLVGAVAGGVAWALGLSVLLPVLVGAVVALVMIFLILVIRQMLVVLLIILAPLAFVAFLLPNTEQWFTKWRKMFVALLVVFPLIGLLFGASSLISTILSGIYGEENNIIGQIVAAGILVLPLLLLPSLLKGSLNAAGSIGTKINGIGSKLSKGASSKTAGSGVLQSLANQKRRNQAQIGAGIYSGKNPVSKLRSSINSGLNKNSAYNKLTGDYGTRRGAKINELENEETKLAEAAIQLQTRGGVATEKQFAKAIEDGDIVKAKAAQNILMRQGGPGVDKVRDAIIANSNMRSDMSSALASNLLENHALAAKQKGADVLAWAGKNSGASQVAIDGISADTKTWENLSAQDLANQSDEAFRRAITTGGIKAATIEALKSSQMRETLTEKKRAALYEQTRDPAFAPSSVPAQGQPTSPANPSPGPAAGSEEGTIQIPHDAPPDDTPPTAPTTPPATPPAAPPATPPSTPPPTPPAGS